MNAPSVESFGPTPPSDRIQVIDILRGIALFGILMVNMHYFAHPWYEAHVSANSPLIDVILNWITNAFFVTKFFSLFSFLFGLGISVQMSRAEASGRRFFPTYARRLLILMVFGLAHALLIWVGDILFIYSIVGFLVLVFWRNAKPRTLLIWVGIIGGLMLVVFGLTGGSLWLGWQQPDVAVELEQMSDEAAAQYQAADANDRAVYSTGSFIDITRERWVDFGELLLLNLWISPSILIMFLLGLYFGKRRLLHDIDVNLPLFKRMLMILLPIGLITNIGYASLSTDLASAAVTLSAGAMIGMMLLVIGGPALSLSYVALVALLTRNPRIAKLLAPFGSAGRMALTNYLVQSLVMTTVFYGYGLGLYGTTSVAIEVLIVIGFYALQVAFSQWWMARFRFGPFEWLWRTLTYGRSQPLKLDAGSSVVKPA